MGQQAQSMQHSRNRRIADSCPACAARQAMALRRREAFKQLMVWAEILIILTGIVVHLWF